ncbi:MAG: glycosyltransferase family 39 protein [Victivallales bacterium]|nr:glycosyltransferase family 39 protein [Victivallales bacterium]
MKYRANSTNLIINSYQFKDFLIIFVISLTLAFLYIRQAADWYGIFINFQPSLDMKAYLENAQGIINGNWPGTEPFFRAPLYSYILAFMILIGRNLFGIATIQALFYSSTVGIIYLIADRLFNRKTGWLAAFLTLFYGGAFYWIIILHSTVFEFFLASLTLFFTVKLSCLLRSEKNCNKKFILYFTATGFAFGLLCLIRTNFLVIIPFFAAGYFVEAYRNKNITKLLQGFIVIALICASLWTPVLLHNKNYSGLYLTTNAAPTWNYANTEGSDVYNAMVPYGKKLNIDSIAFWEHQLKKLIAYWSSFEYPQNVNFYLFKENLWILKLFFIPFGLIAALFIVGLALTYKNIYNLWSCWAFFFPYYISISLFFIIGRFRIPGIPPMIIIASAAIYIIFENINKRKMIKTLIYLICIILVFVITDPFKKAPIPSYSYRGIAVTAMYKGRYGRAVVNLEKIKKMNLNSAELLAAAFYLNGNIKKALLILKKIENTTGSNYSIEAAYVRNKGSVNLKDINITNHPILFYILTSERRRKKNADIKIYTNLY